MKVKFLKIWLKWWKHDDDDYKRNNNNNNNTRLTYSKGRSPNSTVDEPKIARRKKRSRLLRVCHYSNHITTSVYATELL